MVSVFMVSTGPVSAKQLTVLTEEEAFETASKAAKNMEIGWNVGNALDSYGTSVTGDDPFAYETSWGNPATTRELVATVKDAGFNVVRVPVTWFEHLDGEGNISKEWLERVEEVVNYVLDEDMYCIINVHHDTGAGDEAWLRADLKNYDSVSKAFSSIWTQVAEYFQGYDEKLLFEGYNEMLDAVPRWSTTDTNGYTALNQLAQVFVDAVRSTGGSNINRNLIVNTYGGDSGETEVGDLTPIYCLFYAQNQSGSWDWMSTNATYLTLGEEQHISFDVPAGTFAADEKAAFGLQFVDSQLGDGDASQVDLTLGEIVIKADSYDDVVINLNPNTYSESYLAKEEPWGVTNNATSIDLKVYLSDDFLAHLNAITSLKVTTTLTNYTQGPGITEPNLPDKVNFELKSSWEGALNGEIIMTNLEDEVIEDWNLEFVFDGDITSIWNAEIISHESNNYKVKNVGWNKTIEGGSSISFGFSANCENTTIVPSEYHLITKD